MSYQRNCQWPGCKFGAQGTIRRGESMKPLNICAGHAREFHDLTNKEAKTVSDTRQRARVKGLSVGTNSTFGRIETSDA